MPSEAGSLVLLMQPLEINVTGLHFVRY